MNTKHTPGPWSIDQNDLALRGQFLDINTDYAGVLVASVVDLDYDRPECEANARLIAAAPELLESLQEILDASDAELKGQGSDHDPECPFCSKADKARAVIAKATGQADAA